MTVANLHDKEDDVTEPARAKHVGDLLAYNRGRAELEGKRVGPVREQRRAD